MGACPRQVHHCICAPSRISAAILCWRLHVVAEEGVQLEGIQRQLREVPRIENVKGSLSPMLEGGGL